MKKIFRRLLVILLVILILIQFVRPAKNLSAGPSSHDILTRYKIPDTLQKIFSVACNDCHSNNTRYPWYSKIQPVYWWLNNHIKDGKRSLNFSEFTGYPIRRQYNAFKEISKIVKEDGMPLSSYLWIHKDAILTRDQKGMIINWATAQYDSIRAKYPADSLLKR
jgi:hypothetical protein